MTSSTCELVIRVESLEGQVFELTTHEARVSGFIMCLLRDMTPTELDQVIPLPTVPSKFLTAIVAYLKENAVQPFTRIRRPVYRGDLARSFVPVWVAMLLEPFTDEELLRLHEFAGFLQIFMLEMVTAALVAWRWKTLSEQECLARAGLDKPLTDEEQDRIRAENPWAFEETAEEIISDPGCASTCA